MQRYDRGEFEIKMCNWRQTTPIIPNILLQCLRGLNLYSLFEQARRADSEYLYFVIMGGKNQFNGKNDPKNH